LFIDSCWNENLYDVNLKGDFKMKKVNRCLNMEY